MQQNHTADRDRIAARDSAVGHLLEMQSQLGDKFPKTLLLINGCNDLEFLKKVLLRIPIRIVELIQEITIFENFDEESTRNSLEVFNGLPVFRKLRFCRTPESYGYGDILKNGFDYALAKPFDNVIIFRADGRYDPDQIPQMMLTALRQEGSVVLGSRVGHQDFNTAAATFSLKTLATRGLSFVEDIFLGMGLKDYHCGFRLYCTDVLRRIPYKLNAADYLFDLQVLIQIRILGARIFRVPVSDFDDSAMKLNKMLSYALRALGAVIGYRLHQLHLLRRGLYFVADDKKYTLKKNRYSSHMQIIDMITPGSFVLDLGCGQGLLAREFAKKRIRAVGVDTFPQEDVPSGFDKYFQQDLESVMDLPYGRVFDYIVLSDVIEHIRNRNAVLESLRRYLKTDGQLIVSTGNIAIWFYRLSLLLGRFEYGPKGILDRTHVHLFTFDSFVRQLQKSGYRIFDVRYTPIPFELALSSTGRSMTVERITRCYHFLTKVWPRLFAYQFIACCKFNSYESAENEQTWKPVKE